MIKVTKVQEMSIEVLKNATGMARLTKLEAQK